MKQPPSGKKSKSAPSMGAIQSEGWLIKTKIRISSLELALKIKPGFFWRLSQSGDDWSFLIKIHTLLEMSIGHLIQQRISVPELDQIIEKVPMNGGAASKLKIASALSLLDKDTEKFITALSSLRNKAAHQIDAVNFTMDDFIHNIEESEIKNLFLKPGPGLSSQQIIASVKSSPRFAIWASSLNLLTAVYEKKTKILPPKVIQTVSTDFLGGDSQYTGLKGLLDL